MQKLDLLLNYDCLGSERNLRALNLASCIGIDIISDPSCNRKQKTCVNTIHVSITTTFCFNLKRKLERNF